MFNRKFLAKKTWVRDLQNIQKLAVISPKLKEAVEETIKALKLYDWNLAYQLTAVKSHITGVLDPKDKTHAFQEDQETNEKILNDSVYGILDSIHHEIALALDEIPSGMVVIGLNQTRTMKLRGTHPIIRRMQYEHRAILK